MTLRERATIESLGDKTVQQSDSSILQRDLNDFHQRLKEGDGFSRLAGLIALFGGVFPATGLNGFSFFFRLRLSSWEVACIASVSCAIAFSLYYTDRRFWYAGILPGLVTGPLMAYATYWYTKDRPRMWDVETLLPMVVGALPGALLYYHTLRQLVIGDSLQRQLQAAESEGEKDSAGLG